MVLGEFHYHIVRVKNYHIYAYYPPQKVQVYYLGRLPLNARVYVLALESFYHNVDTCIYIFHDPLADGDGTWSSYLYLCHKPDICNLCTFYVVEIHDT